MSPELISLLDLIDHLEWALEGAYNDLADLTGVSEVVGVLDLIDDLEGDLRRAHDALAELRTER